MEEFSKRIPPKSDKQGPEKKPGGPKNPKEIFEKLDTNGNGYIDLEEFKAGKPKKEKKE